MVASMPPPITDRPTRDRIRPWVLRLPIDVVRVIVREGTTDTPCGDLTVGDDREIAVEQLAELIDGTTESAGRTLGLHLTGVTADLTQRARLPLRTKPGPGAEDSGAAEPTYSANPNEMVKVAMESLHGVMELWTRSYDSILRTYQATQKDLVSSLTSEREARRAAEDALAELRIVSADTAMHAERAVDRVKELEDEQRDNNVIESALRGQIEGMVKEHGLGAIQRILGGGSAQPAATPPTDMTGGNGGSGDA